MDQARRQFLRGKFLTHEGREAIEQQQSPLGVLPPWHSGKISPEGCSGCNQPCVESCEQDIIRIHPPEHQFSGMPYLDFSQAGCTYCFGCAEACPVIDGADQSEIPVIGLAELNRMSCHAWNDVFCVSCMYRCDQKAIVFSWMKFPEINADLCTGCGQCVYVCPANAITVKAITSPG